MTDGQLRELARRFAASGGPTDEARLLAERLRVGDLDLARRVSPDGAGETVISWALHIGASDDAAAEQLARSR